MATVLSKSPKYRHVADLLRQSIQKGELAIGDKLPPMIELASAHGVSLATAFRAVQVISEEGLVSCNGGRGGTTVQRKRPVRSLQSTLIAGLLRPPRARSFDDNFALDMIDGLRDEISQSGYRLLFHGLDESDYQQRVMELVDSEQVCGCLLDQKTPLSTIQTLVDSGVVCVLFNREVDLPKLSMVGPDYQGIGRQTVRYFRRQGYEKVAFYRLPPVGFERDPSIVASFAALSALLEGFLAESEARGYGQQSTILLREPPSRDLAQEPETYGLPRQKPCDWQPLGILAASDKNALNILSAVERTDLVLGQDVGVVSGISLDIAEHTERPPSSWKVEPRAIGTNAVRELISRLEGTITVARSVKMTPTFIDRGTA